MEQDPFAAMERKEWRYEDKALYWDERRREQLGFMNNLLFGLALAALVFLPDTLANSDVRRNVSALYLAVLGLALLGTSLLLGLGVGLSRLTDFREEAKLARERTDPRSHQSQDWWKEFRRKREEIARIGDLTWRAFWAQMIVAVCGFLLVLVALILATLSVVSTTTGNFTGGA